MNVLHRGVSPPQLVSLLLSVLLLVSAGLWAKVAQRVDSPLPEPLAVPVAVQPGSVASALGATRQAVTSASSRFTLVGLLSGPSVRAVALISVDGKPAKPFRLGDQVADNLMLHSLSGRRVLLAPTGVTDAQPVMTIELLRAAPRAATQPVPRAEPRRFTQGAVPLFEPDTSRNLP